MVLTPKKKVNLFKCNKLPDFNAGFVCFKDKLACFTYSSGYKHNNKTGKNQHNGQPLLRCHISMETFPASSPEDTSLLLRYDITH